MREEVDVVGDFVLVVTLSLSWISVSNNIIRSSVSFFYIYK